MKGWHKYGVGSERDWPYRVGPRAERGLNETRTSSALKRPLGAYFRVDETGRLVTQHGGSAAAIWCAPPGRIGRGARGADRTTPAALTPLRSLLVLETEQDYARFGVATPEPVTDQRHIGEEGRWGRGRASPAWKSPPDVPDPHLAQGPADAFVRQAGILGTLQQTEAVIGQAYGIGGSGLVGTGSGGGGTAEGTIGLGNLGTIGRVDGSNSNGSGYGRGVGGLGGRRARAPDVIPGQASVRGPARQGDRPPHHPPPHQRGEVLLRAGADQESPPRRPRHRPVHHRGVGPGHRLDPSELEHRKRAGRDLHRAGCPPLGVLPAAWRAESSSSRTPSCSLPDRRYGRGK